jgi:hypothetical protein
MPRGAHYWLSLPERAIRSLSALVGGATHETAVLVLPRFFRSSRLYEATAKNLLRVLVEGVGGVRGASTSVPGGPKPKELAKRKAAGNVVELGSIAAFGFSPLWLLAIASDVAHGSRTYLDVLVAELKEAGVLAAEFEAASVDQLLAAVEGGTGTTARLIDIPPLELEAARATLVDLRSHAEDLPSPDELAAVYGELRRTAEREQRPLLEVSAGVGLAFLTAAGIVGRDHVARPYGEDWEPLRQEGFAAYARRISAPYRKALVEHLDGERPSFTERALGRLSRDV